LRVLFVEDDAPLGASAKLGLEQDGFAVDWATDGAGADRALTSHRYDAVVLDLGLPDVEGERLLRSWRGRADRTPVIVLTARGFVLDRVRLLNLGADDYLVKPFDLLELCARIRAVVRRASGHGGSVLECGALKLYPDSQTVQWRGRPVELTSKEFWLLEALVRNRNRIMTRRQLEDALYGWGDEVESNAVEVHVHHLRRKLARELILTVRGAGYSINHDFASR
jgi:DNA-binding response OmpR family regulator